MRRIITFIIPLTLLGAAAIVIALGRGYRIDFVKKEFKTTGILVATSEPDGAQVFIDNKFTGATNSNINLDPGWYEIKFKKEGYQDWVKKVRIRGEGVVKTNAILFRSNPSLSPLVNTDVLDPILSPDGTKIAYIATPLANPKARSNDSLDIKLDKPTLFLLDLTSRSNPFNKNPRIFEESLENLLLGWVKEEKTLKEITLRKMPVKFIEIASSSARILSFSPDETKVLYEATASAKIARVINPPLIGADSVEEKRDLEIGRVYVYDAKEDKNYEIEEIILSDEKAVIEKKAVVRQPTPTTSITKPLNIGWFGNSLNLYLVGENQISIMEYTGENRVIVYSGPFVDNYVFSHPNGKEMIILTTLNPVATPNPSLYTLNVR